MNITFFIGNGFDLNLGLKTSYSDFITEYKKNTSSSKAINRMCNHMDANSELWSDAEIALGQLTGQFEKGEGKDFQVCQKDFCEKLAAYLKEQEEWISYQLSEEKIKTAFTQMNHLTRSFPPREKEALDMVYQKHATEGISFQFISFNYTHTLDKCLDMVKNNREVLGSHRNKGTVIYHKIGPICHIHGTVDENMIFAVNDESQIADSSIFECENGDLYKSFMIKSQANELFGEYRDEEAKAILDRSQIVYIYGMSIGITDKLWWNRICDWLRGNKDRHLIIYKHGITSKGVFPIDYHVNERNLKYSFLNCGECDQEIRNELSNRIHITGENIFEAIAEIV